MENKEKNIIQFPQYILVFSPDSVTWKRYKDFSWNTIYDAEMEMEEMFNKVVQSIMDDGIAQTHYFEVVREDYFEKFGTPFC